MAGSDEDFLSRWSRRKRTARSGAPVEEKPAAPQAPIAVAASVAAPEAAAPREELPPVESLTPESDFTPFMDRNVDPAVRRQALQRLFTDPRFNVMDGLDVYIDDYSIPDPMPPEWLGQLAQMTGLGDVPGRQKAEREARELAERQAREQADGHAADDGCAAAPPGPVPADAPASDGAGCAGAAEAGLESPGDAGADARAVTPDRHEGGDAAIPARKLGD